MKKLILFFLISAGIITGCKSYLTPDLSSQLKNDLANRLRKINSVVVIDSFKVVGVDTIVPRMGKIIDDTIYIRQLRSVQEQLAHAMMRTRKDSIEYFQDEVSYMTGQIDSLTESIKTADTTHKFGILARCNYQVSKNGKHTSGSLFYFIQNNGYIFNGEMLDSFLTRSCQAIK
ncbi:MAG: hypothetical protein ABJB86_15265 [Bacteroidota bacterium]